MKGLELNHVIPIKLTHKIETLNVFLNSEINLRLINKSCYKTKTFGCEEHDLLKEYRKIRKSLMPINDRLSTLTENELEKLHINQY